MSKLTLTIFSTCLVFSIAFGGVHAQDYDDVDELEPICPQTARSICFGLHLEPFVGKVECDKPLKCGGTLVGSYQIAPRGTECEWDSENPKIATKVCNEGRCVPFIPLRGDC